MKNVKETINLPALFILTNEQIKSIKDLESRFIKYSQNLSKGIENSDEKSEIHNLLPLDVRARLNSFGVHLPTDKISMTMSVGDFFYSIYIAHVEKPEAPLAIKRYERKLSDYAELMYKEEIDLPEDMRSVIIEVMLDDNKWKNTKFGAIIDTGPKKYIIISHKGITNFEQVLKAAEEALGD